MSRLTLIMSANEITSCVRSLLTLKLYANKELSIPLTARFIRIRSRLLRSRSAICRKQI